MSFIAKSFDEKMICSHYYPTSLSKLLTNILPAFRFQKLPKFERLFQPACLFHPACMFFHPPMVYLTPFFAFVEFFS